MKSRIIFLDNLRTFMIFLVVLYHAGFTYQYALEKNWIVLDSIRSDSLGLVGLYLDIFIMSVLFFISGYFIPQSVKTKSTLDFAVSKFRRIMLPWLIAVLILIPAYKVIFLFSRGLSQEAWFTYFHTFQRSGSDLNFFANNPSQHWLWFLPVLFLFQILYLALSKVNLLSWKISLKTGVIFTFIIGIVYSMTVSTLGMKGWYQSFLFDFQRERLLVYFMFFLLGSLCYKLRVFDLETSNRKFYLLSNIVLTVMLGIYTVVAINLLLNMIEPGRNYFFISRRIDGIAYYTSLLLLMLSFLHILTYTFKRYFNQAGKLMTQLNKNAYYVYIVHMIVLGVVAMGLVNLSLPSVVKYLLLTFLTFAISNILVFTYYRSIQKSLVLKVATLGVFMITFFTITYSGNNKNALSINQQVSDTIPYPQSIGLHEAALKGNMEAIKQHIAAGSDMDIKEATGGSSPLITAAVFGKTEVALALIKAGADVNIQNHEGSTALHTAAFFCRLEIVEVLLNHNADITIKNRAGSTAFDAVGGPFEAVKGIYDYFREAYGPIGLDLDYEKIKTTRPLIAEMLKIK